ncbi:Hypothetical protein R9X50_00519500 [Acrodontium crateriforme]|uniref:C2H2-type domain-containing protein n=1 Tax=Acrodontium crateriforme TaxID=150365 RepID=A0AAQ3M7E9_9PEZI|nr:Hypothetical protein R9X50_00519500 [Acrodontium crateriforme]
MASKRLRTYHPYDRYAALYVGRDAGVIHDLPAYDVDSGGNTIVFMGEMRCRHVDTGIGLCGKSYAGTSNLRKHLRNLSLQPAPGAGSNADEEDAKRFYTEVMTAHDVVVAASAAIAAAATTAAVTPRARRTAAAAVLSSPPASTTPVKRRSNLAARRATTAAEEEGSERYPSPGEDEEDAGRGGGGGGSGAGGGGDGGAGVVAEGR